MNESTRIVDVEGVKVTLYHYQINCVDGTVNYVWAQSRMEAMAIARGDAQSYARYL
jgi:hypothetical protein